MKEHIGLMGTHGTGKSTFAGQLWAWAQDYNPGAAVTLVKEVARRCPMPVNLHTSALAQTWIFTRQIWEEAEAISHADWIICDRTAIDSLAYAYVAGLDDVVDAFLPPARTWM